MLVRSGTNLTHSNDVLSAREWMANLGGDKTLTCHPDAAVVSTAAQALQILADFAGQHFKTLHAAAHHHRRSLPNALNKQLQHLSCEDTLLWYFAKPWADDFITALRSELAPASEVAPSFEGSYSVADLVRDVKDLGSTVATRFVVYLCGGCFTLLGCRCSS